MCQPHKNQVNYDPKLNARRYGTDTKTKSSRTDPLFCINSESSTAPTKTKWISWVGAGREIQALRCILSISANIIPLVLLYEHCLCPACHVCVRVRACVRRVSRVQCSRNVFWSRVFGFARERRSLPLARQHSHRDSF